MNYLLDTNAVSEWVKPRPDPGLVSWVAEVDEDRVFLSAVTLAELSRGVERLAGGRRRQRLEEWLSVDLPFRFEGRILAIDETVAREWGRVVSRCHDLGRPISIMDAFIAATARVYGLLLVTRNVCDFEASLQNTINPWSI